MKLIFAALASALAFFGQRGEQIDALKQEIADRDKIIDEANKNLTALHVALDAEAGQNKNLNAALDDSKSKLAETTKRAEDAEKSLAELNSDIEAASSQAGELIEKVNKNQGIPITVGENGGVVHDEEHPANNTPAPSDAPAETASGDSGQGTNTEATQTEADGGNADGAGSGDSK